jgi:hypothetical protein
MAEIVLSEEQSQLLAEADGPVVIRTRSGDTVGVIAPAAKEFRPLSLPIEELIRRLQDDPMDFPTTAEVLARLGGNAQ